MGRVRTIVILAASTTVLLGCAGRFIEDHPFDVTPSANEEELVELQRSLADVAAEVESTKQAIAAWEEKQKSGELQGAFAEIAKELETLRLPCREQMTLVDSFAGLPVPSEIASLPTPGPLDDEMYDSLLRAAKTYQTCASIHTQNLANLETTAYKRLQPVLEECGTDSRGCRIAETRSDFRQGPFEQTDRNLDVAIEGTGFFCLADPITAGIVYARSGAFAVNAQGELVLGSASTARVLEPAITVPSDTLDIVSNECY